MDSAKRKVYEAARDGAYVELCGTLIRMSISERHDVLETKTQDGDYLVTPLIIAAHNGHLNSVKILLRYGADTEGRGTVKVQGEDVEGCSPLWAAAKVGRLDVVKLLIEHNAEVDGRTATNSTPLRAAVYNGHHDVVRCLVEKGADVNALTEKGNTPLMVACFFGHEEIVSYLIARGADIKLQDEWGYSALHRAVQSNNLEIASDLMALGVPQSANNDRLTPLLLASNECKIEMVENLTRSPKCTKEQRTEALELLGGTIANESKAKCDTKKAFSYMKLAMEERFQDLSHPLRKQQMKPVEAYENRNESQTLEELDLIEDNDHAIHMEGLMIRERILGTDNIELCDPLRYRGAVFADSENYDFCIALWLHAMTISQHNGSEKVVGDLSSFCELFCEMVKKNCPPRKKNVEEVFETAISEYERLAEKAQSNRLEGDSETNSLHEKLETLVHNSLYLVTIFTRVQEIRKKESSGFFGLIQRFLSLNPCTRDGNTLLHLSVWSETPNDLDDDVRRVCKFPYVKTTKLILSAGGNVNAVNNEGNSALHLAVAFQAKNNYEIQVLREVLQTLLDAGVNKDLVNCDGKKAVDVTVTDEALRICAVK